MSRSYYKSGDYNAACDRCGRKFKASELRLTWDGLRVCQADWEPRHSQERVRASKDDQSVPWSRPWPASGTEEFEITYPYLDLPASTSY